MGNATNDGRVYMNQRVWKSTRETLRRCCVLRQELDEGMEQDSWRPPNRLSADVLEEALDRYAEHLESLCKRRFDGTRSDWRLSITDRENRWRRTALGETEAKIPQSQSPPPQAGPTIDEH